MRAMKDSGIEWIGQIPQEWEISRVKHLYDVTLGKMLQPAPKSDDDELCSYMCAANINWSGVDLSVEKKMWFSAKDKESYRLAAGDLLVTEGGDVAVSCIWNDELPECYIQNAVHRVRPKSDASNRYLYYWLSTLKATGYIDLVCNKATLAHFTKDKFDSCVIPVVSADEQHTIANYLDVKCAEIDALIATKEKTNALLKERRQSIIYEAVTKGLNPDAPMKDSGIEWIGKIPEHWSVGKTIYGLEMPITDGPHETPQLYSEGVPFVSAEAVSCGNGRIDFDHIRGYISEAYYDECCKKYIPRINDIYMIKSGATTGKVAIVDTDRKFTIWSPLAVFRCLEDKCYYKYLFYFLQSDAYQKQVESKWSFGTQQNIGMRTLERLMVCFSTIDEQKCIADYLDDRCSETDRMILANEVTIQKLKEYRQSVIYEAVTGKIEV